MRKANSSLSLSLCFHPTSNNSAENNFSQLTDNRISLCYLGLWHLLHTQTMSQPIPSLSFFPSISCHGSQKKPVSTNASFFPLCLFQCYCQEMKGIQYKIDCFEHFTHPAPEPPLILPLIPFRIQHCKYVFCLSLRLSFAV